MPAVRGTRRVVIAAGALSLLAGCGAASGSAAQNQGVASLSSPGAKSAAAPQASPTVEGVLLPDNASPAETKLIVNAYYSCLEDHGVTGIGTKSDGLMAPEGNFPDTPLVASAEKACASMKPHPPWQEIPADNPNYQADMAKWENCMDAKGIPVKPVPGGWTFVSSTVPADESQVQTDCEMQAFGED
jgi:hypothetical protein